MRQALYGSSQYLYPVLHLALFFVVAVPGWLCIAPIASAGDCILRRAAELPILDNANFSPIVEISINDKPRRVLLDTGAYGSIVDYGIITNEKGYMAQYGTFLGIAGIPLQATYRMNSVQIGPIAFKKADFFAAPAGYLSGFDATLGQNYLQSFDIEIDPIKNTTSFFLKNDCEERIIYWPHQDGTELPLNIDRTDRHVNITVVLDGKEIPAILDTGSSETYLDLTAARRLFGLDTNSTGMKPLRARSKLVNEDSQAYRYKFDSLVLGDITFKNPRITLANFNGPGPKMILGMRELHGLHLLFAYGQGKLYITTARGDIAASEQILREQGSTKSNNANPMNQINAKGLISDAYADIELEDFDSALKLADSALRLDPNSGFAYLIKSEIAFKRGDKALAEENAGKAIVNHSSDTSIYLQRIRIFFNAGLFERAFDDSEKLIQLQPNSVNALNRSCWYGGLAGKLEAALADCNAALSMKPDDGAILDTRAYVYFKANLFDQAKRDFNAALKLNPREAHSLYGRGLIEKQLGDASNASDDMSSALRLNPKVAENFDSFGSFR